MGKSLVASLELCHKIKGVHCGEIGNVKRVHVVCVIVIYCFQNGH